MTNGDIQRATIQFRHRKAQLIVFAAGKRPTQRLPVINMAHHRIGFWQRINIYSCPTAAGLDDMPQIGNQTIGKIDSRAGDITQRPPCKIRGVGRKCR